MNKLENDLIKIHIDIMKNEYYMVDFFWTQAKETIEKAPAAEFTTEAQETTAKIFTNFVAGIRDDSSSIHDGEKHSLSNKDLDKLETHYQEILKNIDKLNEKFPQIVNADFVSKTKEGIKAAREATKILLRDFADIHDEFNAFEKENFSWLEVQRLYNKAEQKAFASQSTRWAKAAQNRRMRFQGEIVFMALSFIEEINKGGDEIPSNALPSTTEELNFLQKLADEFPKILDFVEKNEWGAERRG